MFYRPLVISLVLGVAIVLSGAVSVRASGIQGQVRAVDGSPLKGAEVRIERTDKNSPSVTARTDRSGRYAVRGLDSGVYRVTVADGAVKSSIQIKTDDRQARLDFELKPMASKRTKHYVWVAARTGSHIGGGWVEADNSGAPIAGSLNEESIKGEAMRDTMRRATGSGGPHGQ